jgi:hypothetical protein
MQRRLSPGQMRRNEIVDAGMNREMSRGVIAGPYGKHERNNSDPPRTPDAQVDDTGDG